MGAEARRGQRAAREGKQIQGYCKPTEELELFSGTSPEPRPRRALKTAGGADVSRRRLERLEPAGEKVPPESVAAFAETTGVGAPVAALAPASNAPESGGSHEADRSPRSGAESRRNPSARDRRHRSCGADEPSCDGAGGSLRSAADSCSAERSSESGPWTACCCCRRFPREALA